MPRTRKAVVYWEKDIPGSDDTVCMEVECSVGPVERDPWCYGAREVEIIEVRDNNGLRPDLLDSLTDVEVDLIYSEAIDTVASDYD